MAKACDFCVVMNQYVCEGHCGACDGMVGSYEPKDDEDSESVDGET
jgi:hypothetical protein